jgi:hypothetical protein
MIMVAEVMTMASSSKNTVPKVRPTGNTSIP